jgi:hypothetical protein
MAIEGVRVAAIFRHWVLFGLPQMSMLRNASANRRLFEQASAALVYLGIVTAFAVVSSIICVIWLLIW